MKDFYTCTNCTKTSEDINFEDTEHDGDLWGTCPNCGKYSMLFEEDFEYTIESIYHSIYHHELFKKGLYMDSLTFDKKSRRANLIAVKNTWKKFCILEKLKKES